MMNGRYRSFQSGFSLVELGVAAAVFSIGLGSLSLMMLAGINGTSEARHQTVATSQASSMAAMIAMSSDAYGHYIYPPGSVPTSCDADSCDDADVAAANLLHWQRQLNNELPGGLGVACRDSTPDDGTAFDPSCDGNGAVVVKIFWAESRHTDSEDGGQRRLVSRLPW